VIKTRRGDLDHMTAKELYDKKTLCSNHFQDNQFMNPAEKNKLIATAVPTIFTGIPNPPKLITPRRPLIRVQAEPSVAPGKCKF
jgi:hypothetical protein